MTLHFTSIHQNTPQKMKMSNWLSFSFLVLLLYLLVSSHNVNGQEQDAPCYQRIFNFGDSLSDTGNLIRESSARPAIVFSHLPYGQSFPQGPTGRCSDGRLMIDYIAESLGLPLLVTYLSIQNDTTTTSQSHGVNFALAGATALEPERLSQNNIDSPVTNSSLIVQLNWFKTHLNSTSHSEQECSEYLAKALFMLGEIGGNDYNYAFRKHKSIDEVKALVPIVVSNIKDVANELIALGAKELVVPGNLPIGCMPMYLTNFKTTNNTLAYDARGCLQDLNAFACYHNEYLQRTINQLSLQHPNVTLLYANYYNALDSVINDAPGLGFAGDSILKACCGTGGEYRFNLTSRCGSREASVCANPSQYVSWDGIHMTQQAYQHMATWLLDNLQLQTCCTN